MTYRLRIVIVASFLFLFLLLRYYAAGGDATPSDRPTYQLFNSNASLPSTPYAIATFLTGQGLDGEYLTATRVLAYQLLHAPGTKVDTSSVSFLVICSPSVPVESKLLLEQDGAVVVEVEDVPLRWWIHTGVSRWKEQFVKLRLLEMTEYGRIVFVDADTMIMSPLDGIFSEPEVESLTPTLFSRHGQVKSDEGPLPPHWLFAARSDNALAGEREHSVPPLQTTSFSAGFWLVAPNKQLFAHVLSVMSHYRRFDPHTMEQSLLNYVFRRDGPMPWRELGWKWSATWPNERDAEMGVASLHEKWWKTGPEPLQARWERTRGEMDAFYGSKVREST